MEYSDQIAEYLFEDMSPRNRRAFKRKMRKDAELSAEVEEQKAMLESIHGRLVYNEIMEDPHLEEADRIAKEIVESLDSTTSKKAYHMVIIRRLAITAAMLLFLFILDRVTEGITPLNSILRTQARKFALLWRKLF